MLCAINQKRLARSEQRRQKNIKALNINEGNETEHSGVASNSLRILTSFRIEKRCREAVKRAQSKALRFHLI
jgi:hypothetical protein